ncbi:MAG: WD40 repeat domain-containing protein [Acidimicrobiales bacterium]
MMTSFQQGRILTHQESTKPGADPIPQVKLAEEGMSRFGGLRCDRGNAWFEESAVRQLREDLMALAGRAEVRVVPGDVLERARISNRRVRGRRRLVASVAVALACLVAGLGLLASSPRDVSQRVATQSSGLQNPEVASSRTVEAPLLATTADYVRTRTLPSLFYFGSHADTGYATDGSGSQVSVPLTGCGSCSLITFEGGAFTDGYGDTQGKIRRIDLQTLSATVVADPGSFWSLSPDSDGHSIWIVDGRQAKRMDLATRSIDSPVMLPQDRIFRATVGSYFLLTARGAPIPFELWDRNTGVTRILAADAVYLDSTTTSDGDVLVAWYSEACVDVVGCELRITNVQRGVSTTVPLPQSRYGILGAKFSPSAKYLAVLSSTTQAIVNNVAVSPDGELVMVEVANGLTQPIDKASGGIQGPPSFQWSADSNWLIFGALTTRIHRLGTPDAAVLPIDGYRYAFRPEP